MKTRRWNLPFTVLTDASDGESRAVNPLHVQTFIANQHGEGTVITFASGDVVIVKESFDSIVDSFMSDGTDG